MIQYLSFLHRVEIRVIREVLCALHSIRTFHGHLRQAALMMSKGKSL